MPYRNLLFALKMLCVIGVSLFMVYAAMIKLVDYPGMKDSFVYWGYPTWMMYAVGVVELALAVLFYIPKTRYVAALGLWILIAGAIYTHLQNGELDQLSSAIAMLALSLLALVSEYISTHIRNL